MLGIISSAWGSINSINDLINSTYAQDIVYLGDEDGQQILETARIRRVGITIKSEIFEHPLETGNKIADFAIIRPVTLQVFALIPAEDTMTLYTQLRDMQRNGTRLSLFTRADAYDDLIIEELPHEESPEVGDCLSINLLLREVQWFDYTVESLPVKAVQQPKDADTKKIGNKTAIEPEKPVPQSLAKSLLGKLK